MPALSRQRQEKQEYKAILGNKRPHPSLKKEKKQINKKNPKPNHGQKFGGRSVPGN